MRIPYNGIFTLFFWIVCNVFFNVMVFDFISDDVVMVIGLP